MNQPCKWHETVWSSVWLTTPWKRHESNIHGVVNQTVLQTVSCHLHGWFMAFSWHFPLYTIWNCYNCFIMFVFVYLSWLFFFIDCFSGSGWSFCFCVSLRSKCRLTRNTQTTKPNPQLVLCWFWGREIRQFLICMELTYPTLRKLIFKRGG